MTQTHELNGQPSRVQQLENIFGKLDEPGKSAHKTTQLLKEAGRLQVAIINHEEKYKFIKPKLDQ